ncbi:MAG: hypothetical protein JWL93_2421 [Hyphomicrobiales bacterium]|jgi:hypothetical protein|nr:hypothetical protein [Hyphomicrobiales bacterium]
MRFRLTALAVAMAGFAALSSPASAASAAPSNDGRIVVAQNFDVRIGEGRPRYRDDVRIRERRVYRGPERCRVTVVRERRPNGRVVERRIRRCR